MAAPAHNPADSDSLLSKRVTVESCDEVRTTGQGKPVWLFVGAYTEYGRDGKEYPRLLVAETMYDKHATTAAENIGQLVRAVCDNDGRKWTKNDGTVKPIAGLRLVAIARVPDPDAAQTPPPPAPRPASKPAPQPALPPQQADGEVDDIPFTAHTA